MQALAIQHRSDGNAVVSLSGRLDAETCDDLEADLDRILGEPTRHIVFDLQGVDYISSAGVRLILKARNNRNKLGHQVVAAFANPQAKRVFEAVGNLAFDALLETQPAVDDYLASASNSKPSIRRLP